MAAQLRPLIHFTKGTHKFEVYPDYSGKQITYHGLYDGKLSVASGDHLTVTRMLLRRHGPKRAFAVKLEACAPIGNGN